MYMKSKSRKWLMQPLDSRCENYSQLTPHNFTSTISKEEKLRILTTIKTFNNCERSAWGANAAAMFGDIHIETLTVTIVTRNITPVNKLHNYICVHGKTKCSGQTFHAGLVLLHNLSFFSSQLSPINFFFLNNWQISNLRLHIILNFFFFASQTNPNKPDLRKNCQQINGKTIYCEWQLKKLNCFFSPTIVTFDLSSPYFHPVLDIVYRPGFLNQ